MLGYSPPKILKLEQEIEKPMSCKQCHQSIAILVALLFSGMQIQPSKTNKYCIGDKMKQFCWKQHVHTGTNNVQINLCSVEMKCGVEEPTYK